MTNLVRIFGLVVELIDKYHLSGDQTYEFLQEVATIKREPKEIDDLILINTSDPVVEKALFEFYSLT